MMELCWEAMATCSLGLQRGVSEVRCVQSMHAAESIPGEVKRLLGTRRIQEIYAAKAIQRGVR